MGILCRQEDQGKTWVIGIREKWTILDREELDKTTKKLLDMELEFSVRPNLECYILEINNSNIKFKNDYRKFKNTLDILLDMKEKAVKREDFAREKREETNNEHNNS